MNVEQQVTVTIYHNVGRECRWCGLPVTELDDGTWAVTDGQLTDEPSWCTKHGSHLHVGMAAGYFGYKPGHPLVPVMELDAEYPTWRGSLDIADTMFAYFNGDAGQGNALTDEYRRRKLRSLSVGDVVKVGDLWLACENVGWRSLAEYGDIPRVLTEWHETTHTVIMPQRTPTMPITKPLGG